MKTGRPKAPLALTAEEVTALQRLVTTRSTRHGLATRARLILLSHEGLSHAAIAEKLGLTHATVGQPHPVGLPIAGRGLGATTRS